MLQSWRHRITDGAVVAAVELSGDNSDNDEHCAVAGVRVARLRSEPA